MVVWTCFSLIPSLRGHSTRSSQLQCAVVGLRLCFRVVVIIRFRFPLRVCVLLGWLNNGKSECTVERPTREREREAAVV